MRLRQNEHSDVDGEQNATFSTPGCHSNLNGKRGEVGRRMGGHRQLSPDWLGQVFPDWRRLPFPD